MSRRLNESAVVPISLDSDGDDGARRGPAIACCRYASWVTTDLVSR